MLVIGVVRTLSELYNVRCSVRTVLARSRNTTPTPEEILPLRLKNKIEKQVQKINHLSTIIVLIGNLFAKSKYYFPLEKKFHFSLDIKIDNCSQSSTCSSSNHSGMSKDTKRVKNCK